MVPPDELGTRVLLAPHRVELDKIKGSRFLGSCAPVADEGEAEAFVASLRREFPDATHHCFAWRIVGERYRYSDDGEPSGTAGKPLFAVLKGRNLRNAAVVVTRWYGGTKLGAGGLVRAYSAAAGAVLDAAPTEEWVLRATVEIAFGYEDQGAVRAVLHARGFEEERAEYGASVRFELVVLAEVAEELREALVDRTAGRATVRVT